MNYLTDEDLVTCILGVVSAVNCLCVIKERRRETRKYWTRPWILRRGTGKDAYDLIHAELKYEDSEAFNFFLRMNQMTYTKLLKLIKQKITKKNTVMRESISPARRLSLTLRFLATGESYHSLQYAFRIPPCTISQIIPETCTAIYECLKDIYLKVPNTPAEWRRIADEFNTLWHFPNCLGALDGKHINFAPPKSAGSYFFNYKKTNSIVLLALVDAKYKFLFYDVGCNGRISDGGVYRNSLLSTAVINNTLHFPPNTPLPGCNNPMPYVIVADDAFQLQEHIMKPYSHRDLDNKLKIFNYRLSRARGVVENAFGILANRFRVFLTTMHLPVNNVEKITLACVALHNFLIEESPNYLREINYHNTSSKTLSGKRERQMISIRRQGINHSTVNARIIRNEFCEYFNTTGAVSWQEESIKKCRY